MKKQLLCTSAIALGVAAAAPASAAEWNVDWGGFMNTHVAISDLSGTAASGVDLDGEGLDLLVTGEIIFTPSITLDNGLKFGVNVQFEAQNTASSEIDESYVTISGSFGQLDIGSENSAGYKSMVAAPSVTSFFINSPSVSAFVPFSSVGGFGFRQAALSAYTEVAGNNDVNRITYYTPSFNGLTVGVSYAPHDGINANTTAFNLNTDTVNSDIFDIGVNYGGSFNGVDVSFGARWGTANGPSFSPAVAASAGPDGLDGTADDVAAAPASDPGGSDPETWGVGAQVSFSGFTVGGSYTENDNGAALDIGDQFGWSAGISYDLPGPWLIGFETYQGEINQGADDEEYSAYQIGARRNLGPGVNWDIHVTYVEAENGTDDIEGTVFGTALNLSF